MMPPNDLPSLDELKKMGAPDKVVAGAYTGGKALEVTRLLGIASLNSDQPNEWPSWQTPSRPLPIDEAVEGLMAPRRASSPRISPERQADRDTCPFYQARYFTAWAVERACYEEVMWKLFQERLAAVRELGAACQKAYDALEDVVARLENPDLSFEVAPWSSSWLAGFASHLPPAAANATRSIADIAPEMQSRLVVAAAELSSVGWQIEANSTSEDVWKTGFAFKIGQLWGALTGNKPATQAQSLFVKLVSAAFRSVSSEDGMKWDSAKTNAHNRDKASDPRSGFLAHAAGANAATHAAEQEILLASLRALRKDGDALH